MPEWSPNAAILAGQASVPLDLAAATALLRRRLAMERWPVPPAAFPAGTALVGGAVRDGLLGRLGERPDLDLVVPVEAIALGERLSREHGGRCVVLDQERSIARLVIRGWSVDLARQAGADLATDLLRRDFCLNALALPLTASSQLLDPSGGLTDLAAGLIRAVSEANLLDDPLRLLRGERLAAELGFHLDATSAAWIQHHSRRIDQVAVERVRVELEKLAACASGGEGLARVLTIGLLDAWRQPDAVEGGAAGNEAAGAALRQLTPAAAAARGLSEDEARLALPLARLATLLDAASWGRLHASRALQRRCGLLRSWRAQLEGPGGVRDPAAPFGSEREQVHFHRDLEDDLPALLLMLPLPFAREWLPRWRDPGDPLFHPRPPLDGTELQQRLGLAPSRRLGELLAHLTIERAFGRLESSEEALAAARRWLAGPAP
ncbi:MAG: poly-A polymerase [Cyanobium sp.]|uniref:CCA tRNA nucleotidyltransferase n=1 Tax=Synechococcus sp. CS-1333 TaxID=2848638 RepID=UPI000DBBF3D1|nr:CCA tRNA nucleotidyltransferase [Synechococcus sp. CS-1333]MCT0209679.1 CCA tRNA nucleotidyltransferase [Synechococcus sp. CS-1333]PZV20451.1 MAG: poly-A polymerase [Cyanobium sp.]